MSLAHAHMHTTINMSAEIVGIAVYTQDEEILEKTLRNWRPGGLFCLWSFHIDRRT